MRDGYTTELLAIERRRRRQQFGHQARVRQLKWATGLLFFLACVCWLHLRWYPSPSTHVWIDGVLVEVVAEGWLASAAHALLLGAALCCVLLLAFTLCGSADRDTSADIDAILDKGRRRRPTTAGPTAGLPSLRIPRRTAAASTFAGTAGHEGGVYARTAASLFDPARPMRTPEELNSYLDSLAQQRVTPGRAEVAGTRGVGGDAGYLPSRGRAQSLSGPSAWSAGGTGFGGGTSLSQGTVRVLYEAGGTEAVRAAQTGVNWSALGVLQPDLCLSRLREWACDMCRTLIDEVDQCDRWFRENDVAAFDCANPLAETVPNPPAPALSAPAGGLGGFGTTFGAAAAPPPAPAGPTTKQMVLMREKAQMRNHQRTGEDFRTSLRYDQRLSLEARLDLSTTFAPDQPPTAVELRQTRAYVLHRLRTLAKQRTLVSFTNNGGDPQQWRPGLPCDAHLLLHVVRTGVEGLFPYVRFGYQGALTSREDLALFVGDTGAPYFYVRHFRGGRDRLYVTHPGQATLFEAVLVFAALIHLYHADRYGGVRGTVDLEEAGLLRVLTGRSTPQDPRFAARPSRSTF